MKKTIPTVIIIGAVVVAISFIVIGKNKSGQTGNNKQPLELLGQEIPVLDTREHVSEGTKVTNYNSNPPTSGDHWPEPANWGSYIEPLPDEQLVHNLEHGGIWISYKDIDVINEETGKRLEAIIDKYPQAVIITHRPENDTQFAIASWGRLAKSDSFDFDFAEQFIKANINHSPEKLASLEKPAIGVGNPFPDFKVTEVDGRTITPESLKGKPVIIWFTTSWCVPCQIGAREVSKLDSELGGGGFDVLVIFVDPREKNSDLTDWRNKFANPDWLVAFDSVADPIASKVNLKFLDSKYLLDKNGVIKNIDFQTADDGYLGIIRQAVKEN